MVYTIIIHFILRKKLHNLLIINTLKHLITYNS